MYYSLDRHSLAMSTNNMDDPKSSVPFPTSKVGRNKQQENVAVQNFLSSSVACLLLYWKAQLVHINCTWEWIKVVEVGN